MSDSIKTLEQKFALKKATTWGTAVEPSTNDALFPIGGSHVPPKNDRETAKDGDEYGRLMQSRQTLLGYQEQSGSFSVRGYWEGLERIFASIMGHYDSSAPESGVVTHKCKCDPQIAQILHTIAWEEGGGDLKAVNTAVISAVEFVIDGGLRVNVEYLGDKVESKTVAWTDASGWTYASDSKRLFKLIGCEVLLNDETGSTLASSDEIKPSNITIRFERQFETPPPGSGEDYSPAPNEKGTFLATVTFELPKKDTTNAAYFTDWNNNTAKKLSIVFTGDTIPTKSTAYSLGFYFPKMHVEEAPTFQLETPGPVTLVLQAYKSNDTLTENINRGMEEIYPYLKYTNTVSALTGYPAESSS